MTNATTARHTEDAAERNRNDARYLTTEEVAQLTRTPAETVRYWRHMGKGPRSFKLGRRVLYAVEDVERWITEQRDSSAA